MLLTYLLKVIALSVVTKRETEEYQLSRRQARRLTAKVIDLFVQDFEEINIEQAMQKGLINNQASRLAACTRPRILLAGFAADS